MDRVLKGSFMVHIRSPIYAEVDLPPCYVTPWFGSDPFEYIMTSEGSTPAVQVPRGSWIRPADEVNNPDHDRPGSGWTG